MNTSGAIILAGGRSTRMGSDKAGLPFGNDTLLNHVVKVASRVVSHQVIILNRDQTKVRIAQHPDCQIQIGRDSKDRQGPLQGIADALTILPETVETCYVLSCDLPYLTSDWLLHLRAQLWEGVDVVCTCVANIANPLLAFYRRDVLEQAPRLLAQNIFRPIRLWDGKNIAPQIPPLGNFDPGADVNTREQFIQALHRFNLVIPPVFQNEPA